MAIDISNSGVQIAIINKCIGHFLNFPLFVPHINKEAAMGGNGAMKPPINIKFILAKNDGNKGDDGTANPGHYHEQALVIQESIDSFSIDWSRMAGNHGNSLK